MVIATFELNGVKVKKEIPLSWNEVTFGKYLSIIEANGDKAKILSILTEIDHETIKKAKIKGLDSLMALLNFVNGPFDYSLPKAIKIGTHEYHIAENLELEEVERYSDLDGIVRNLPEDKLEAIKQYPLICATYAVNPYDYKDAENLSKEFFNAPCTEVMAVGNFTVLNFKGLKNIIPTIFPRRDTPLSRLRLVLRSWVTSLVFTLRYYSWKRTLRTADRRYLNGRLRNLNIT